MFTKTAVIACLALAVSAQTFTNSSTSAAPSATATPKVAPSFIALAGKSWQYLGCGSNSFSSFVQIDSSPSQSIERCLALATPYAYAGLIGGRCYASNSYDNSTTIVAPAQCSYACPGNTAEPCGGSTIGSAAPAKRQAVAIPGALFTLYATVGVIPSGNIYINIFETIYINICGTGLCTNTLTSTATQIGCGCTSPATPSVPVTTTTASCPNVGIVTLTLPVGCPATATSTTPTASISTVTVYGCSATTPATTTVVPCVACAGGSTVLTVTPTPACASCGKVTTTTKPAVSTFTGAASPMNVASGSSAVGFFGLIAAVFML